MENKLNIADLKVSRQSKVDSMASIINKRGENMNEESLAAIKSFKAEIGQIDLQINAINEIRSVAISEGKPVEQKVIDVKDEVKVEFAKYLRGESTAKEYETRAATIGAQGDIVPDEFLTELQETILEYGNISSEARHITTANLGELSIPVINDTANAGVWTAESGTITKSDFATAKKTMNAYKVATGIEVSSELIEDSFFNLESYIAKALGQRLARTMEAAFVNGTGSGQPLGVLKDNDTISYASSKIDKVIVKDIISAIYELAPTQRVGAKIYVSDKLMKSLTLEVDTNGRPLLQSLAGATPSSPVTKAIDGYPVVVNVDLEDVATGSESCFIGNLNNYLIRDVRNIKVSRDEFSGMAADMVSFYANARVDGKVISANKPFVKIVTA